MQKQQQRHITLTKHTGRNHQHKSNCIIATVGTTQEQKTVSISSCCWTAGVANCWFPTGSSHPCDPAETLCNPIYSRHTQNSTEKTKTEVQQQTSLKRRKQENKHKQQPQTKEVVHGSSAAAGENA
jgi:hypothetical protein